MFLDHEKGAQDSLQSPCSLTPRRGGDSLQALPAEMNVGTVSIATAVDTTAGGSCICPCELL